MRCIGIDFAESYLLAAVLEEVDVVIEYFDEQLYLYGRVHALTSDFERFLQTFHHALPILHLKLCHSETDAIDSTFSQLSFTGASAPASLPDQNTCA